MGPMPTGQPHPRHSLPRPFAREEAGGARHLPPSMSQVESPVVEGGRPPTQSRPPTAPGAFATAVSPVPGARDPKLAERLAASIEAEVLATGWPVGRVLGSEDQLTARFGVGRAVLREAVRLTEHRQVAQMRRGRKGGLVVVEPDASAVITSLAIYLDFAGVTPSDLFESRMLLETLAVDLAAAAPDEEHLLAFRAAVGARPTKSAAVDLPATGGPGLHELVARATGNPAVELFVEALVELTEEQLAARLADSAAADRVKRDSRRAHDAIGRSLIAGDGLRAREHMTAHLAALRRLMLSPADAPPPAAFGGAAFKQRGAGDTHAGPRGSYVASRILADIASRGWPVGESLGFEPDLLQRYGVGRAQFREAVRILEGHSVIRMHRGAAGGMVVAAPDGRELARAASLYLGFRGVSVRQVAELREALEADIVRLVIDRLDQSAADRLWATVDRERTWPDDQFPEVSHDLHAVLADLSGNRTTALMLSVVMQLTAERLHTADPNRTTESPDAVRRAHRAIVEAIVAGDLPLAQRRVRKHLRALSNSTLESPRPTRLTSSPVEALQRLD